MSGILNSIAEKYVKVQRKDSKTHAIVILVVVDLSITTCS